MKAIIELNRVWCWLSLLFCGLPVVRAQGIPEPSLIFYGTIRNTAVNNLRVTSGTLTWQIRKASTGRTITLSTIVSNYPGFSYVLEVPAETIVSGPVSSNALDLSAVSVTFDRSQVIYDSGAARTQAYFVTQAQSTFNASSLSRGRIEQVDLTVSMPCADLDGNGLCDDWELRYFGFVGVDPNKDSDGDGLTNYQEFLAGTDPTDPNSALQFTSSTALPEGGTRVEWESADGRLYSLLRTTNLWSQISTNLGSATDLIVVQSNIVATPPRNTFIDTNTPPPGPYFYRLKLEQ